MIMDLNYLKNFFRETAWMIDPFYKALNLIIYIGGPLTAMFVLLLAYNDPHSHSWVAGIIILSMIIAFKLGPSPFFVLNCTWIYFRFGKFGLWLPIISYLMALTIYALQYAAQKTLTSSHE